MTTPTNTSKTPAIFLLIIFSFKTRYDTNIVHTFRTNEYSKFVLNFRNHFSLLKHLHQHVLSQVKAIIKTTLFSAISHPYNLSNNSSSLPSFAAGNASANRKLWLISPNPSSNPRI